MVAMPTVDLDPFIAHQIGCGITFLRVADVRRWQHVCRAASQRVDWLNLAARCWLVDDPIPDDVFGYRVPRSRIAHLLQGLSPASPFREHYAQWFALEFKLRTWLDHTTEGGAVASPRKWLDRYSDGDDDDRGGDDEHDDDDDSDSSLCVTATFRDLFHRLAEHKLHRLPCCWRRGPGGAATAEHVFEFMRSYRVPGGLRGYCNPDQVCVSGQRVLGMTRLVHEDDINDYMAGPPLSLCNVFLALWLLLNGDF